MHGVLHLIPLGLDTADLSGQLLCSLIILRSVALHTQCVQLLRKSLQGRMILLVLLLVLSLLLLCQFDLLGMLHSLFPCILLLLLDVLQVFMDHVLPLRLLPLNLLLQGVTRLLITSLIPLGTQTADLLLQRLQGRDEGCSIVMCLHFLLVLKLLVNLVPFGARCLIAFLALLLDLLGNCKDILLLVDLVIIIFPCLTTSFIALDALVVDLFLHLSCRLLLIIIIIIILLGAHSGAALGAHSGAALGASRAGGLFSLLRPDFLVFLFPFFTTRLITLDTLLPDQLLLRHRQTCLFPLAPALGAGSLICVLLLQVLLVTKLLENLVPCGACRLIAFLALL